MKELCYVRKNRDRMPYLLYFSRQRLLVENIDGHIVDIGGAERVGDRYRWQLDGKDAGEKRSRKWPNYWPRWKTPELLFVDGQFTSLPDVSADYGDRLDNAPSRQLHYPSSTTAMKISCVKPQKQAAVRQPVSTQAAGVVLAIPGTRITLRQSSLRFSKIS